MKAELCPVCRGKGTICNHAENTDSSLHSTCPTCHGCGGRGWVEVKEERSTQTYDYSIDKCPYCGNDKHQPGTTGCPYGGHYGTYCLINREHMSR